MKTNAIVRIVLFSIAFLILLSILALGLLFGIYSSNTDSWISSIDEELSVHIGSISDGTVSQAGAVDASQVSSIEIDWVAGSITIQHGDVNEITFSESEVSKDKYKMVWKQEGSKLSIQFSKDSSGWTGIHIGSDLSKDLVITVPQDWNCDELDIDAASANVTITDLTVNELDFAGASGKCVFNSCDVNKLDVETVSGDIKFDGTLDILNCEAVSANCYLELTNVPSRIDLEGVSGDLDITLPANSGFSASMDSVSGHFSSDFETSISAGNYTCGDGACLINVSCVSGDVIIRKGV